MRGFLKKREIFLFEGLDEATSWRKMVASLPLEMRKDISLCCFDDLNRKMPLHHFVFEELVFFVNFHSDACVTSNGGDFGNMSAPEMVSQILQIFEAKRYYFHFGGCSYLSPSCVSPFDLLSLDPRIKAVSGFSKDIDSAQAQSFETTLLKELASLKDLSYSELKGLKESLKFSQIMSFIRLGFRLYLN